MPGLSTSLSLAASTVLFLARVNQTAGHAFQILPVSRQFSRTRVFNAGGEHGMVEKHADAYNGGGPEVVKSRQIERTDPEVLEKYGGGDVWPWAAAWDLGEICPNGNYLENDDIAVSHGVCGDTPQSGDDAPIIYSTPNSGWDVLAEYTGGQVIDMDIILTNYHWGHMEFFVCCTADLDDPDGVVTQSCFNKYPLDRADDDSYNSPVDTSYPGRYYVDPPCRGAETDQTRPEIEGVLNDGNVLHMRYKLPDISCDHAVLQMRYHSGTGCKSPGYDEFNPDSWPSECAPNKEDWIATGSHNCNSPGRQWGNIFWNCSDIKINSSGSSPGPSPGPSPEPQPEPQPDPVTPGGSGGFSHVGCFTDNKDNRVLDFQMTSYSMTTAMCAEHCSGEGAKYMATQHGDECWCSNDENLDYGQYGGSNNCNMGCYGDSGETCGGWLAFDLYSAGDYLGCYADDRDNRVMGNELKDQSNMTPAVCRDHCEAFGSAYYATEYGDECWCGDSDTDYGMFGESDGCVDVCTGDSSMACGGYEAMSVYKF